MRRAVLIAVIFVLPEVAGCALPDWMIPRLWKPVSSTAASRQSQQDRYDRKYGEYGTSGVNNGNSPGLSNRVIGASATPDFQR
jgi:hypothetical protein